MNLNLNIPTVALGDKYSPCSFPDPSIKLCKATYTDSGGWLLESHSGTCYQQVQVAAEPDPPKQLSPSAVRTQFGGQCYVAFDLQNPFERYVIKAVPKCHVEYTEVGGETPLNEMSVLEAMSKKHCRNIIRLREILEDSMCYYIVEEYGGAMLLDVLNSFPNNQLSEGNCKEVLHAIINGMEALHNECICNRDASPENLTVPITMTSNGLIPHFSETKLIDFGLALKFNSQGPKYYQGSSGIGKPSYMAPEVYRSYEQFIDYFKADIFAIGAIIYVLLTGHHVAKKCAYANDSYYKYLYQGIDEFSSHIKENWRCDLSEEAIKLLFWTLQPKPEDRPTLAQIRAHPWLSTNE